MAGDRGRAERFLRTLVGLLLVGFVVVALFSPLHPLFFLAGLVPAWVLAGIVAAYLVSGGDERLRESPLYDPALPAAKSTALFAGVALGSKLALTAAGSAASASALPGYHVLASVVALAVGYLTGYGGGLARALGALGGTG